MDVTISDVISGEDGLLNFTADEVPYDSVQETVGAPPLTAIHVTGTVHWTQTAVGTVDFGTRTIPSAASSINSSPGGLNWPADGALQRVRWAALMSARCVHADEL